MGKEKSLQNAILQYLNCYVSNCIAFEIYNGGVAIGARGGKIIYKKNGPYRPKGIPDIYVCFCGKQFFIETKRPAVKDLLDKGGTISEYQHEFKLRLEGCGGRLYYARSVEDVQQILSDVTHQPCAIQT